MFHVFWVHRDPSANCLLGPPAVHVRSVPVARFRFVFVNPVAEYLEWKPRQRVVLGARGYLYSTYTRSRVLTRRRPSGEIANETGAVVEGVFTSRRISGGVMRLMFRRSRPRSTNCWFLQRGWGSR